ncbi:hypothetical protein J2I47_04460 [Fibrella sp. HMF5335]|uniref:LVIVD repeat-containing protein n=1 Tax=Fibrella rubiginis TaxID=2817060 RepID=A0A939GBF7_9BACT|nr:hypothetical protein [Fibrella rubiginis]MBO0935794.1 hypothetical protein [Fibrella rubiginis]
MPTYTRLLVASLLLPLLLDGCKFRNDPAPQPADRSTGYRAVYISNDDLRNVVVQAPQPLVNPGKIYIKDGYLFVNDQQRGIHIIDNRNPAKPIELGFLRIPGNSELAVKDSTLYANNGPDLVAVNISKPGNVRVVKRISNVFAISNYPDARQVWFDCPDPAKGYVVGWERTTLTNPQCYR